MDEKIYQTYKKIDGVLIGENETPKERYERLSKMPEENIARRMSEIQEALDTIDIGFYNDIKSRNRTMMRNGDQEEIDTIEDEMADIAEASVKLAEEKKDLEGFNDVKAVITIIGDRKEALIAERKEIEGKLVKEKMALDEAKAKAEKITARIREIKEEQENLAKAKASIKSKKAIEGIDASMTELDEELKSLGYDKEKKQIAYPADFSKAEELVNRYSLEWQEKQEIIKVLSEPWENILDGMNWKEISTMNEDSINSKISVVEKKASEDVLKRQEEINAIRRQNIEQSNVNQASQEQKPSQGEGNKPKVQGRRINVQSAQSQNSNQPQNTESQAIEDEQKPQEQGRDNNSDNNTKRDIQDLPKTVSFLEKINTKFKSFINRHPKLLNFFKRFSKEVEEQAEETNAGLTEDEKEAKKLKGEALQANSKAQQLYVELQKAQKEDKEALEKMREERRRVLNDVIKVYDYKQACMAGKLFLAEGVYSEADITFMLRSTARKAGMVGTEKINIENALVMPDQNSIDAIKGNIDKQIPYLSLKDIDSRTGIWKELGIYNDEEIKEFKDECQKKENAIEKKKKIYYDALQTARELKSKADEAEKLAEETRNSQSVVSAKERHEQFTSRMQTDAGVKESEIQREIATKVNEILRDNQDNRSPVNSETGEVEKVSSSPLINPDSLPPIHSETGEVQQEQGQDGTR